VTDAARRVLLQRDLGGNPPDRILKVDVQAVMEILPLAGALRLRTAPPSEEIREDIPQITESPGAKVRPAEVEPPEPGARLRPAGSLSMPVVSELIVLAALLGVAQYLVGFREILELAL
jgi:hypothetical protein